MYFMESSDKNIVDMVKQYMMDMKTKSHKNFVHSKNNPYEIRRMYLKKKNNTQNQRPKIIKYTEKKSTIPMAFIKKMMDENFERSSKEHIPSTKQTEKVFLREDERMDNKSTLIKKQNNQDSLSFKESSLISKENEDTFKVRSKCLSNVVNSDKSEPNICFQYTDIDYYACHKFYDNLKIYYPYTDIELKTNIINDYNKGLENTYTSYWMGVLDIFIKDKYSDVTLLNMKNKMNFEHNLKFCVCLFIYDIEVSDYITQNYSEMKNRIYLIKRPSYFTNNTDILFEWNKKNDVFTIGYDIDIEDYCNIKELKKYWILFENDIPIKFKQYMTDKYGYNWVENLRNNYQVYVLLLDTNNYEHTYEILFRYYKQCVFYYSSTNVYLQKSKWFYECFENGTPILTNNYIYFDIIDSVDSNFYAKYNLITSNYSFNITNLFNIRNIQLMSSYIYKYRNIIQSNKYNLLSYFKQGYTNHFDIKNYMNNDIINQSSLIYI